MGSQAQNWFMDILRDIFAFFDSLVYSLFRPILYGIFDMSGIITNSSLFVGIYRRLYVVLGVFMAFKLLFSFIQYIVNPDQFSDKSKGVGKLFMNVFIMLAALIFLPPLLFSGFTKDGEKITSGGLIPRVQQSMLPVLPKIILGYTNIGSTDDLINTTSKDIIKSTLGVFFSKAADLDNVCDSNEISKLDVRPIEDIDDFNSRVTQACTVTKGAGQKKFLFWNTAKVYTYVYIPIISTAIGVLLLLIFLAISIDLAKRCFKLVILEIIAPIPIMSLIDPKSSKGDSAFGKWSKNLISTFVDIFIKVGLLYLILVFLNLIVSALNDGDQQFITGLPAESSRRGYLVVLLLVGLVYFAKEAPKFIKDSLGMKADKGGFLDDVKSIAKTAGVIGGAGLGIAAASTRSGLGTLHAMGAGLASGEGARDKLGRMGGALVGGVGNALKSAITGGVQGAKGAASAKTGLKGVTKGMTSGWKGQGGNAARVANAQNGSSMIGRIGSSVSQTFTGKTMADRDKRAIEANKAVTDSFKSFDEFLGKKANNEMLSYTGADGSVHQFSYGEYSKAMEQHDAGWALSHGFNSIAQAAGQAKAFGKKAKEDAYSRLNGSTQARLQSKVDQIQHAMDTGDWASIAAMGINSSNCVAERDAAQAEIDRLNAATSEGDREAFRLHDTQYNQALSDAKLEEAHSYADMDHQKTAAENKTLDIQTRTTVTGKNKYQRRQRDAESINNRRKKK